MIVINNIDTQRFTFNGVEYYKNFTPIVIGTKIRILNAYDSTIELTDSPRLFSEFEVDGLIYSNVNDLQSVLLPILYSRNTLGGGGGGGAWSDLTDFNSLTDATTPLSGTEEIPIVQSGVTKKVAVSEIGVGATPSLQAVTDIGNTTTNDIQIESTDNILSLYPTGLFCVNNLDNVLSELTANSLKFDNGIGYTQIIPRNQTQNTDFYFEDEGGEKSIATREWVNSKSYLQWLVKDTTPTTAVTGTTSVTQIGSSILIPADTFNTEDVMILDGYAVEKLAGIGTCLTRLWHNTSDTLIGATSIARLSLASASISGKMIRTFEISEGLLKCRINGDDNFSSDISLISASPLSIPFDVTIDNYFFVTVQLGNASDSVTRKQLLISK